MTVSHNFPAAPTITNPGTGVTAAANNIDSTPVALISSLSHEVKMLTVMMQNYFVTAEEINVLIDIVLDPAGTPTVLIPDILGNTPAIAQVLPWGRILHFPVFVASGATIGARARTNRGTDVTTGTVIVIANSEAPSYGTAVEAIGIDAANSAGTSHTPGNSGAYSSWVDFGSPISAAGIAIQFAAALSDASATNNAYYFEFGIAGVRIGAPLMHATGSNENSWQTGLGPQYMDIPASTQLQVRGTCSGTAEAVDLAAYVTTGGIPAGRKIPVNNPSLIG